MKKATFYNNEMNILQYTQFLPHYQIANFKAIDKIAKIICLPYELQLYSLTILH